MGAAHGQGHGSGHGVMFRQLAHGSGWRPPWRGVAAATCTDRAHGLHAAEQPRFSQHQQITADVILNIDATATVLGCTDFHDLDVFADAITDWAHIVVNACRVGMALPLK
jgi:hypothetical protein